MDRTVAGSALDQVRALFAQLQPAGVELTVDQLRANYETLCGHAEVPTDIEVEPVDADGVPALWVRTPGASDARTVVWLHSGGYLLGSAHGYRGLAYALSRAADARVLLVDYRLAPEHPFPAAFEDAVAASRWAIHLGGAAHTVLAGDSAGGGLVVAALTALRDTDQALPAAGVCVSALFDLAATGESMDGNAAIDPVADRDSIAMIGQGYLQGRCELTDPRASPLYAELAGLPPLLLMVGTADVLLDDSVRLGQRCRDAGGEVVLEVAPGMVHIWPLFHTLLPQGRQALTGIGRFVRHRTAS